MILINLLPHREAARRWRRERFYLSLGASAIGGLAIAAAAYLYQVAEVTVQQARNDVLRGEIVKLDEQIKGIATLQREIVALRARQQAVEDLQADRNMPAHILIELVRQLPDGVYLTSLKQDNQAVAVTGVAQSNERVSELLRNLGNNSPWLTQPELVEIVAGTVSLGAREQRRVANFHLRVKVLRASDLHPAGAAPAPVPLGAGSGKS